MAKIAHGFKWLKKNCFYSPWSTGVTLICGYMLFKSLSILDWLLWDANWSGAQRSDCQNEGACWPFIIHRLNQFIFGFYPIEEQWRVICAAVGLVVIFGILGGSRLSKTFKTILAALGGLGILGLLSGGILGLTYVPTEYWGGLFLTLLLALGSILASFPISMLLALGRQSKMGVVGACCTTFIELVRGVPLISVLFMASVMLPLFLPHGWELDKLIRALIGITLFQAAYLAEVIRAGLIAVPKGQYEAAIALGMGYWRTMGLVILPQALKMMIPGIVNTFIALFKDTSLVLIIGLFDFLGIVQAATTDAKWLGTALEGYVFCALVYWIFCFALSSVSKHLEVKTNKGHS